MKKKTIIIIISILIIIGVGILMFYLFSNPEEKLIYSERSLCGISGGAITVNHDKAIISVYAVYGPDKSWLSAGSEYALNGENNIEIRIYKRGLLTYPEVLPAHSGEMLHFVITKELRDGQKIFLIRPIDKIELATIELPKKGETNYYLWGFEYDKYVEDQKKRGLPVDNKLFYEKYWGE
ncbi:hypothetical protein ACFL54_09945 [Planctomycetota bacterium]